MDTSEAGYDGAPVRARATPPNQSLHLRSKVVPAYSACMRRLIGYRADGAAKRVRREFLRACRAVALPVQIESGLVRFRAEQSPALSGSRRGRRRSVLCGGVVWSNNQDREPLPPSAMFPSMSKRSESVAGSSSLL